MKRRTKLWIAGAALAVVVALCTFALLYRPVPYLFLEGSRFESADVVSGRGLGPNFLVRAYKVRGTMETVAVKAQAELTPADGWTVHRFHNGPVQFERGDKVVVIKTEGAMFWYDEDGRFPSEPGTVWVHAFKAPSSFDRFLHWLQRR